MNFENYILSLHLPTLKRIHIKLCSISYIHQVWNIIKSTCKPGWRTFNICNLFLNKKIYKKVYVIKYVKELSKLFPSSALTKKNKKGNQRGLIIIIVLLLYEVSFSWSEFQILRNHVVSSHVCLLNGILEYLLINYFRKILVSLS